MITRFYLESEVYGRKGQATLIFDSLLPKGEHIATCRDHLMAEKICNFLNWQGQEQKSESSKAAS